MEGNIPTLVDHVFRRQAGQMVSTLTRIFGSQHIDLAEEVVQEAMLKALQQWPFQGVPQNPTAWLIQVAKNRALDVLRRESSLRDKSDDVVRAFHLHAEHARQAPGIALPGDVLDDELGMMFMACHPDLPRESRIALTLKTVSGFGVSEIARAFLAKEATVAQRLVRAKRQIRDEGIVLELPTTAEMSERLDSVLEVLYLLFNEGYTAHQGENLVRADLCEEAVRLGQLLVEHPATGLPKSHALLALMFLQAARLPARTDDDGELFLLAEQDRSLWDRRLIYLGLKHLDRSAEGDELTEYHLQAGIAAIHATAPSFALTNWEQMAALYDQLQQLNPSPVIALNRAVALSQCHGPAAGIQALEEIAAHTALHQYYLLPATLGELWYRQGEMEKAAAFYRQALECSCSEPERRFLQRKLAALIPESAGVPPA